MCSYIEIEQIICAAKARAHEEQLKMKEKENRLMWSEVISRPIARSERSFHQKIARKIYATYQQEET